ncbi:uncharacterized protein LOC109533271 isoform X2 [Dendroctonus ponderosae]|uniref:F-box domain-containing protein n=1 Tax=Dendroctonus ponderosae TaxID=77166 RepID=A0AAR5NYU5_DENPD|nr:uncharacterized protein LOC109533271 isoform X2 [Dendroctonus ponderosae]KAH1022806.1 hypothetical protein HUJ04_012143 [Dendroctonus ponderosae]KAH1029260.1 hypothetical protein HUJ05_002529 [Dendroctonus ponderosae]
MDYTLDSYGNFDDEQHMLETEGRKKADMQKREDAAQIEENFRLKCIRGYYMRLSWHHKKQFILAIVQSIDCFDTLLRIISYISSLYGKMAAYSDASTHCRTEPDQILVDHDRSLEGDFLRETICNDLGWLSTLPHPRQILLVLSLLQMGGSGLIRKMYIPIVNIYNRKLLLQEQAETQQLDVPDVFAQSELDDSDKYPSDHPMTMEVTKMRKKWDDAIAKLHQEVFGLKQPSQKPTKAAKKPQDNGVDWIQMLPIWIVKKILNYFDQKTLQSLKKVNRYWAFVCDGLIKDRQTKVLLDQAIQRLRPNLEGQQLWNNQACSKARNPREKRLDGLLIRGAVRENMRPKVRKTQQVHTSLVTSLPKAASICKPLEKIAVFPRLIREDLLLYTRYPCVLKDVNIVVDLEEHRRTLSYSLSRQLSDTFSLSEVNLSDW